jgi:hypothetical protein
LSRPAAAIEGALLPLYKLFVLARLIGRRWRRELLGSLPDRVDEGRRKGYREGCEEQGYGERGSRLLLELGG